MGENKREALKKVYPHKRWIDRVQRMSDAQVTAIYLNLKSQNKL
jgi:hypothetical protein